MNTFCRLDEHHKDYNGIFKTEMNSRTMFRIRTGFTRSSLYSELIKDELMEFISVVYEASMIESIIAAFNGKFNRCDFCRSIITEQSSHCNKKCTLNHRKRVQLTDSHFEPDVLMLRRSKINSEYYIKCGNSELVSFITEIMNCGKAQAINSLADGRFKRCKLCGNYCFGTETIFCSRKCGRIFSFSDMSEERTKNFFQNGAKSFREWFANISEDEYSKFCSENSSHMRKYIESLSEKNKVLRISKLFNIREENLSDISTMEEMSKYISDILLRGRSIEEVKAYKVEVNRLTELEYRKYKDDINPYNLKRGLTDYHIDHIYSVSEGFFNGVDPEIIASRHNLRMLKFDENISKSSRCDKSLEQLKEEHAGGIR